eukprot:m51a1_g14684 hypothetical protein (93) ;mRNA; f:83266-84601
MLSEFIKLYPDNPVFYVRWSGVLEKLGRREEAGQHYYLAARILWNNVTELESLAVWAEAAARLPCWSMVALRVVVMARDLSTTKLASASWKR